MSDEEPATLMFLGRDLVKIPCFRKSILYGLSCGIGVGLASFLATSRSSLAVKIGMGTYVTFTMTYFTVCRYDHLQQRKRAMYAEQLFRQAGLRDAPAIPEEDLEDA